MKKLLTRSRARVNNAAARFLISTPWYSAYITAAAKVYRESDRWRERVSVMGMDYADRAFYNSPFEIRWFKRLVRKDRKLMLQIIFTPYNIEV